MHASFACAKVIGVNAAVLRAPAMQPSLVPVVVRRHSPVGVQHWAAILVPSGAAVAVGEVMQTPWVGPS